MLTLNAQKGDPNVTFWSQPKEGATPTCSVRFSSTHAKQEGQSGKKDPQVRIFFGGGEYIEQKTKKIEITKRGIATLDPIIVTFSRHEKSERRGVSGALLLKKKGWILASLSKMTGGAGASCWGGSAG